MNISTWNIQILQITPRRKSYEKFDGMYSQVFLEIRFSSKKLWQCPEDHNVFLLGTVLLAASSRFSWSGYESSCKEKGDASPFHLCGSGNFSFNNYAMEMSAHRAVKIQLQECTYHWRLRALTALLCNPPLRFSPSASRFYRTEYDATKWTDLVKYMYVYEWEISPDDVKRGYFFSLFKVLKLFYFFFFLQFSVSEKIVENTANSAYEHLRSSNTIYSCKLSV